MASIFSRIAAGEIPCHKVWEDEAHLAFLDVRPMRPGHTLVVPKREVAYLFDMAPAEQAALWEAVREVEKLLRARLGFCRAVLMVVGWEVPHVHVHVLPTDSIADVPVPPPIAMSQEELAALARKIRG